MPTPSPSTAPHQESRRGRPRDPERSRAILGAARDLLHEGGWDALTIEAVASRAGVGRPTVYRRWPTKGHLAAEVLGMELANDAAHDEVPDEAPNTGSLRGDLLVLASRIADRLDALEKSGVLPGMVAEMALDADLARQVRIEALTPDRERMAMVVRQGIERGEVRPDVDPGLVIDVVWSQMMVLRYVVHQPPDPGALEQVVDLVIDGCGPHTS